MSRAQPPLVSIITPVYNGERYLEDSIRSVLAQDYPAVEHIVVDGGSRDATLDILKRYEDRIAWRSERDGGMYEAVNKGLRLARGEFALYLNSDDLLLPRGISTLVAALEADPQAALAYGDYFQIDAKGREIGLVQSRQVSFRDMLNWSLSIFTGTMLFRRSLLREVGFFDDRLRFAADYEFCLRLASRGRRFIAVAEPVALYRIHDGQLTRTGWSLWREALAVNRRYGGKTVSPFYLRYLVTRLFAIVPRAILDLPNLKPLWKAGRRFFRISR